MAEAEPTTMVLPPLASLYVGDLHPDLTEAQLNNAFAEFKSLSSVRICRDSVTDRSLCYGYVNFTSLNDATQAIEHKNHSVIYGKVIRVAWSNRDSEMRKSGVGNLFVKNLSDSIDNVKLQEMFQTFGNILSSKVVTFEDGKSRGYGFLQFESDESANAAIENLNGATVEGKQIYVGKFLKKSERILASPDAKYTNLYIKNFDLDITEELLTAKFAVYGKIVSLVIVKDDHGSSRGFGFVNFESPDEARKAVDAMNGEQLGSKVLYVGRAQKKAEREQILRRQLEDRRKEQMLKFQGSNIYVKNIDDDITEDDLRENFSQCGTITSAEIMRDDKSISKGFGFVCFSTPEEANKAVSILHGYMLGRKPLYVAIAQRKEERHAQLQIQHAQHLARHGAATAAIPGAYAPLYYTAPNGSIISQVPAPPGLIYQPLGLRPGWRPNGFVPPTRPAFQPSVFPIMPNLPRPHMQNRERVNGQAQGDGQAVPYMPLLRQLALPLKDSNNEAGQVKYVGKGRMRFTNNVSGGQSAPSSSVRSGREGPENLSSTLVAATPEQQKQILGESLYPLVFAHEPELAAKITGMLLDMDNSELLLLLESPKLMASKVEEAVHVLKLAKT